MASENARCVCGESAGPHNCTGDPNHPARQLIAHEAERLYTCAECGTEDTSVARGGTALCSYCAELSDMRAQEEGRRPLVPLRPRRRSAAT